MFYCLSATAEILNASGTSISDGHLTVCNNHRHLALPLTVLQHFLHPGGIKFHVIIDMLSIRLTGAGSVRSALLSEDDGLVHVHSPCDCSLDLAPASVQVAVVNMLSLCGGLHPVTGC